MATQPPRRYGDPRISTGPVFASSFDPRHLRPGERRYEAQPIGRRTYVDDTHGGGTTSRTEYAVRPRNNSFIVDESRSRADHRARPISPDRTRPVISQVGRERPRSPPRHYRPRDESDRQIYPIAPTSHLYPIAPNSHLRQERHNSASPAVMDRVMMVANRDGRDRERDRARPIPPGPTQKSYPVTRPPIRYSEDDGYSYTGPREQFARDYPVRPPPEREIDSRRDRAPNGMDLAVWSPPPPPPNRRDLAPPSASARQFEKMERFDPDRHEARLGPESDSERLKDMPRRRHSTRDPVLHQGRDDGYSSQRDDYDTKRNQTRHRDRYEEPQRVSKEREIAREDDKDYDRGTKGRDSRRQPRSRDNSTERVRPGKDTLNPPLDARRKPRSRETSPERSSRGLLAHETDPRRHPRSRENSPDRSGIGKGLAAAGLGGIAAAGLAGGIAREVRDRGDDPESDHRKERRRRRHRDRNKDGDDAAPDSRTYPRNDRQDEQSGIDTSRREPPDSGSEEGKHRRRRHRRRRHGDGREPNVQESSSSSSSDSLPPIIPPTNPRPDLRDRDLDELEGRHGERSEQRSRDLPPQDLEARTLSPGDTEDGRPRRVLLVEPVKDKEPDVKPKGILKPARQVPFPEDPNPIREGVAPLKEIPKPGTPTTARWTKISRMLVNPEALEKSHERFEEREDYVIVLRVLSKEEITKLADKTREIREAREIEWQEELERRKRRDNKHHDSDSDSNDEYREDDGDRPKQRLAIEPPPPLAPNNSLDPRAYQTQPDRMGRPMVDASAPPVGSGLPEIYSSQV